MFPDYVSLVDAKENEEVVVKLPSSFSKVKVVPILPYKTDYTWEGKVEEDILKFKISKTAKVIVIGEVSNNWNYSKLSSQNCASCDKFIQCSSPCEKYFDSK